MGVCVCVWLVEVSTDALKCDFCNGKSNSVYAMPWMMARLTDSFSIRNKIEKSILDSRGTLLAFLSTNSQ